MLESMVAALFSVILKRFPKDVVKDLLDMLLDQVEDYIDATPNKYDDMILNPIIKTLRDYFDIPDTDDLVK